MRITGSPVLDLTDATIRETFGVSLASLAGDTPAELEACRTTADLARQQGFNAILAPSAARPGEENLMVYIDGPAASYHFETGPDRIPLNH